MTTRCAVFGRTALSITNIFPYDLCKVIVKWPQTALWPLDDGGSYKSAASNVFIRRAGSAIGAFNIVSIAAPDA
eukprot:6209402-Pleurochrysis_carterae.AAC.3